MPLPALSGAKHIKIYTAHLMNTIVSAWNSHGRLFFAILTIETK